MELNRDYDDLQDEYGDLVDAQGSTRTMMYGAIVIALIAVIVAVYFGLMKK
jgi:ABC-type phosphate transport system permease subunit